VFLISCTVDQPCLLLNRDPKETWNQPYSGLVLKKRKEIVTKLAEPPPTSRYCFMMDDKTREGVGRKGKQNLSGKQTSRWRWFEGILRHFSADLIPQPNSLSQRSTNANISTMIVQCSMPTATKHRLASSSSIFRVAWQRDIIAVDENIYCDVALVVASSKIKQTNKSYDPDGEQA